MRRISTPNKVSSAGQLLCNYSDNFQGGILMPFMSTIVCLAWSGFQMTIDYPFLSQ
jgi:hypothetical protein